MKVLMITPYVTIAGRPEFERNKTGFGYMVHDIAKAVAVSEQVDVLATDSRGQSFKMNGVCYLGRSFAKMLVNIFHCVKPGIVRKLLSEYSMERGSKMRLWYHWMMTGCLDRLLGSNDYDVVHIHGCTFADELWMAICLKHNVKFVVTLHGLNSFSDTVKLGAPGKRYERDFLKRVVDGEFPITVISTGMKRLIERTYHCEDCKNIFVVCNSFSFSEISGGGV